MSHGIKSKILKWLKQSFIQDALALGEFTCLPISRKHRLLTLTMHHAATNWRTPQKTRIDKALYTHGLNKSLQFCAAHNGLVSEHTNLASFERFEIFTAVLMNIQAQ
jgi:hypothetical protein